MGDSDSEMNEWEDDSGTEEWMSSCNTSEDWSSSWYTSSCDGITSEGINEADIPKVVGIVRRSKSALSREEDCDIELWMILWSMNLDMVKVLLA